MEEIQKYDCIYEKFSKDYKNRRTRENAWAKIAEKFGLTLADAEKKYKNIRTSYVRYLKRLKNVPSSSGRDAVPKAGEFANLEWLDHHISRRKSTTNLHNHESDGEEAIDDEQEEEVNNSSSSSTKVVDDETSPDILLILLNLPLPQLKHQPAQLNWRRYLQKGSHWLLHRRRNDHGQHQIVKSGKLKRRRPGNDLNCRKTAERAI